MPGWNEWPLWLSLAFVALWVGMAVCVNTGQWGDHFEQFVWAHSFEWGYHKHPPLPTWMLAAVIRLFGPSPYWAYALAALCNAGTAFFTWRIAQRLIGSPVAALALLLWGLQQAFSTRAQLFNHNTVMMLAISATVWCVLNALDAPRRSWWIAAGVAAGLSMLAKYQSIVPLGGIVVALLLNGEGAQRTSRRGLLLAVGVMALVLAPHLLWMLEHDFTTLRYASQEGPPLDWSGRGLSVASFLVQQVRLLFPSLLFAALLWMLPGLRRRDEPLGAASLDELARWRRAWFIGLIAFPLAVTLLTCPAFGMRLQNHWGYQCLQFVALWLAWRLRFLAQRGGGMLVTLALLVQALSMIVVAQPARTKDRDPGRRADLQYPAQQLADAVQRDWDAVTSCPLAFIVGPTFEAGMVSVYGRQSASVLENGDFDLSPWVHPDEVDNQGAVHVANDPGLLPKKGVALSDSFLLGPAGGREQRVYWAIVPPAMPCEEAGARPGSDQRSGDG